MTRPDERLLDHPPQNPIGTLPHARLTAVIVPGSTNRVRVLGPRGGGARRQTRWPGGKR